VSDPAGQAAPPGGARAAVSSIARGSPPSRRTTAATASALISSRTKAGSAALARRTNSSTAGLRTRSRIASPASGAGRGRTGQICSADSRSGSRLVARTRKLGHASTSLAIIGAAERTCSTLSSSNSNERVPSCAARRSTRGMSPVSRMPRALATAAGTRVASVRGERSTQAMPSVKQSVRPWATARASRVLPTPPGPVRVRRGTSSRRSRARNSVNACSRPTSGVRGRGSGDRLPDV
jgi:hypothetical protein